MEIVSERFHINPFRKSIVSENFYHDVIVKEFNIFSLTSYVCLTYTSVGCTTLPCFPGKSGKAGKYSCKQPRVVIQDNKRVVIQVGLIGR